MERFTLRSGFERLRSGLESIRELRLLILFGSFTEDVQRESSDIDIVVDCWDEKAFEGVCGLLSREFGVREIHVVKAGWLKPEALLHLARRGVVLVDRGFLSEALAGVPGDFFELRERLKEDFSLWVRGDPIDVQLVMSIVSQVDEDVDFMRGLEGRLEEALADPIMRRALERSIHTAIEGMIDLLRHVVSRVAPGSFETYGELVESSKRLGLTSPETSSVVRELVDTRHTLVHRYRGITDKLLREQMGRIRAVWPSFKEEVRLYLLKLGESSVTSQ